ncbi:hypothetical protein [Ornithinimicrobium panacihumi]|uniref:hypothetical protein n=1 Tax=Ornithinimicrobium panacihumi TaxID=2008449 RepID=UPI003F8BD0C8
MDVSHLEHILDRISGLQPNRYGHEIIVSVYDNWIAAVQASGRPHSVRRSAKGMPDITLLRQDGSALGVIEPVLLPGCPPTSRKIVGDKLRTSQILAGKGIRVPRAWVFGTASMEEARKVVFADLKEVAVKPPALSLGQGVRLRVDPDEFPRVFASAVKAQDDRPDAQVLVQEMHPGFEMRVVVVEGRLHHVLARIPAYVIGDGVSTIDQLRAAKNARRAEDGFLAKKRLGRGANVQAQLRQSGRRFSHVPADGECVLLSSLSNTAFGGETAVVTELVSDAIKDIALRTVAAIPGISTAGCDILAHSFDDEDPVALEINTFPHVQLGRYPTYGEPVDAMGDFVEAVYVRDAMQREHRLEGERAGEILSHYLRFYALRDTLDSAPTIP